MYLLFDLSVKFGLARFLFDHNVQHILIGLQSAGAPDTAFSIPKGPIKESI